MILLTSNSLTQVKVIDAAEMELSLRERDSTASISVENTDGISVNSWMKDDRGPGNGMIWRVKGIRQNFGKGFPEIDLEHIICTLKDRILFGEITPETITGTEGATTCTAQQAITYILNQQSDWTLGTFSYGSVTSAYRFDGDNLFDALKKVSDTFDEPWWSYDLSVYPFRLNITAKPSGVGCEMRAGRNLNTISRTIDKTGMYTRFYPIGKDDLHVSSNYVSKNEATYGVISNVETDQSIDTEAGLTAWANERLNKHAQPRVNITVNGLELANATGETLDRLTLGRICRVPLPEYSTTIEERITELNYPDAINKPESVTVTLSNEKDDRTSFAALISNEIKTGGGPSGGGSRTGARQQKEDHAWLEDNTDSISFVVGTNVGGKYIKAGEITLAINATTGESIAKIMANHVFMGSGSAEQPIDVVIDGKLTTTELESQIALLSSVRINTLNIQTVIDTPKITGTEALIDDVKCDYLSLSGSEKFDDCIIDASVSSNTLTLTYASGSTVTFSKATTQSGAWSSGVFTATALQNNVSVNTLTTSITGGSGTWNGTTVTIPIYATIGSSGAVYNTGKTVSATYPGGTYDQGWNDALAACGISGGGTVYTGTWYNSLFEAAYVGAPAYAEIQNCVGNATGHQVSAR